MNARSLCLSAALLVVGAPAYADEPRPRPLAAVQPPLVAKGIYLVRDFRNPTFAAVASLVTPGGGQVYNDDLAKFLVTAAVLGGTTALYFAVPDTATRVVAGTGFTLTWLWSVGDAYLSAATYNQLLEQQALP